METIIIKGGRLVNRGQISHQDILIKNGRIEQVGTNISVKENAREINAEDRTIIPGIIDDQVHFREPGLTHKANIHTESRAAIAGGTTTFMEMPNTKPSALTQALLQDKYDTAAKTSFANYSFFMGASNDNYDDVMSTDPNTVCGIKIFMGSSTGNMLVDDPNILERLYANAPMLIATHCEDEATIKRNFDAFSSKYRDKLTPAMHPLIRNEEGCYLSSSLAVQLAQKHNTRLHILHISTRDELALFDNSKPLTEKRITAEVCVHHLYFDAGDYASLGNLIKCNPAIKSKEHKEALFPALLDDRLDIIATDHAPHTWEEKSNPYNTAPAGLPLVQHSLNIMLEFYQKGMISMEKIVEKMCHAPAQCFQIKDRGYLDEGMFADLALIDMNKKWSVSSDNILYKCGWSPLQGKQFTGKVTNTFINGIEVYDGTPPTKVGFGQRVSFDRR